MSDSRTNLLSKIKALMAKTTDNGCTEAEALAAAGMAARMMDQHGFATADLEEREPITKEAYFFKGKKLGNVVYCMIDLGKLCDVKTWSSHRDGVAHVNFFGRESDVLVARYLTHLFHTAMERAWREFQQTALYATSRLHGRTLRTNFEHGMVSRLNARMREMKAARNQTIDPAGTGRTGQDIVVVKNREVAIAFAGIDLKLRAGSSAVKLCSQSTYGAGQAAGDRVTISTGVGGRNVLRIAA